MSTTVSMLSGEDWYTHCSVCTPAGMGARVSDTRHTGRQLRRAVRGELGLARDERVIWREELHAVDEKRKSKRIIAIADRAEAERNHGCAQWVAGDDTTNARVPYVPPTNVLVMATELTVDV